LPAVHHRAGSHRCARPMHGIIDGRLHVI
jgi:hypothetical protein